MTSSVKRPLSPDVQLAPDPVVTNEMSTDKAISTASDKSATASAISTPMTTMETLDMSLEKSEPAVPAEETTTDQKLGATSWQGWAELENDPTIFSVLLREWGVKGVQVREVVPLDAIYDSPAPSTYGLIFLSRYLPLENVAETDAPPPELWFANQTSSFSCGTVALMNVINNRSGIHLGEHLEQFRSSTAMLSSKDRGLALDSFDHVRDPHNSFAAEIDILTVDARLKEDAQNAAKKKKAQILQKGKKHKRRKKSKVVEEDEESGFHFIAYVPACGRIWKMDGMERRPQSLGSIDDTSDWLNIVIPDLQMQWQGAADNELEFSLLSLVRSEGTDTEQDDAENTEKARRLREDWGPLIAELVKMHAEKGTLEEKLWG